MQVRNSLGELLARNAGLGRVRLDDRSHPHIAASPLQPQPWTTQPADGLQPLTRPRVAAVKKTLDKSAKSGRHSEKGGENPKQQEASEGSSDSVVERIPNTPVIEMRIDQEAMKPIHLDLDLSEPHGDQPQVQGHEQAMAAEPQSGAQNHEAKPLLAALNLFS